MSRGPRKSKEVREAEARDHEPYAMKRSEFHPRLCCQDCRGFGIATKWLPGVGPVCPECFDHFDFDGRATPAEPGTTAVGQEAQLALHPKETGGPAADLLGQGKELGGERRVAQLALFES